MKIKTSPQGIELIREPGDARLRAESNVVHHMRRLLNKRDGGGWTRFKPCEYGLTACTQGVRHIKLGIWYWHGNYTIEAAHREFNNGKVFFNAA